MAEHTLLTVLGLLQRHRQDASKIVTYEYELGGRVQAAPLAPVALFHLLRQEGKPPLKILAFCTIKAKQETYPVLQKALDKQYDVAIEAVDIPSHEPRSDIGAFLETFARSVPKEGTLTIEITHGFRHYALLMLLGAFYACTIH